MIVYHLVDTPEEFQHAATLIVNSNLYPEMDPIVLSTGGPLIVAVDDTIQDVIGCIFTLKERRHGYLDFLVVNPAYWGQDIDRTLYKKALAYFKTQGVNYVHGMLYNELGEPMGQLAGMIQPLNLDNVHRFYREGDMQTGNI